MRTLTEALARARLETLSDEPLARHTSLGIGGPARLFARADRVEPLAAAVRAAVRAGVPLLALGGGTNLLVADDGFDGLALGIDVGGVRVDTSAGTITAGAAVPASELVDRALDAGLAGLEFAAGLPGSVGGAVAGNAGCFGSTFGERLLSARVVTAVGEVIEVVDPRWFCFDYRATSVARRGALIAEATFSLAPGDRGRLAAVAKEHRAARRERHPPRHARTAGSWFKNLPPTEPGGRRRAAGALLDQVGAKALRVGDAAVFERHANIVINRGAATARDVLALTVEMATRVRERFGVRLEPEVRFVGRRPEGL